MIESVVMAMISLCILVIAVFIVVWVLEQLGIAIPANIMKVLWVIIVLIAILIVVRTVLPGMGIRVGLLNEGAVATAERLSNIE